MQAKRYASPHYPWLNLGHIWVHRGEWGKALSCYEEVWKLAPDYVFPIVPAVDAAVILSPGQAKNPGTMAEQQAVKEAILQYFHAWNSYDADTLKDYSEPPSIELSIALLLHLATAKLAGVTITVHDTEVLHLERGLAIVKASVSVAGKPDTIWHMLQEINETWKVVVRLLPFD